MAPKKAAKKAEPEAKEAAPASERVLRKRKADVPAPTEKPADIPAAPEPAKKAAKAGAKLKEGDTIPSAPLTREDGQEVDFAVGGGAVVEGDADEVCIAKRTSGVGWGTA